VRILDVISTSHAGEVGIIVRVKANKTARTLDWYGVQLESGEVKDFWDIQLEEHG
jgi:hypothetical protein